MMDIDRYFSGKHLPVFGASWWDIARGETKQFIGMLLSHIGVPGFVKPIEIHDTLTGAHVQVRVSGLFTVISIDGRDFYFERLTGKYDGSGMAISACQD